MTKHNSAKTATVAAPKAKGAAPKAKGAAPKAKGAAPKAKGEPKKAPAKLAAQKPVAPDAEGKAPSARQVANVIKKFTQERREELHQALFGKEVPKNKKGAATVTTTQLSSTLAKALLTAKGELPEDVAKGLKPARSASKGGPRRTSDRWDLIKEMLAKGCTVDEVIAENDDRELAPIACRGSVPGIIGVLKRRGWEIKSEKTSGNPVRYFGTAPKAKDQSASA